MGSAEGYYNLGLMYENGQGVEKDYSKAVQYYKKAAETGD
ncbi:SEL1-like repeat protein, partial [Helicobacter sp. NHP22-001]